MCEVLLTDFTPHPSNTRAACVEVAEKYADQEPVFGIEQEYTFLKDGYPLGWPQSGFPAPQGPYYCGVGAPEIVGREIVEAHTQACMDAGLAIEGTNAEVMMGQWEFQIGILCARRRSATSCGSRGGCSTGSPRTSACAATLDPKPIRGDWNGAGAHTNFSTNAMRKSYDAIITACEALGKNIEEHVDNYGPGIKDRLTGEHETAPWNEFSYGASDRGASIRIPWAVEKAKKGWIEDRRPNANIDPYVVSRLITNTAAAPWRTRSSGRTTSGSRGGHPGPPARTS